MFNISKCKYMHDRWIDTYRRYKSSQYWVMSALNESSAPKALSVQEVLYLTCSVSLTGGRVSSWLGSWAGTPVMDKLKQQPWKVSFFFPKPKQTKTELCMHLKRQIWISDDDVAKNPPDHILLRWWVWSKVSKTYRSPTGSRYICGSFLFNLALQLDR